MATEKFNLGMILAVAMTVIVVSALAASLLMTSQRIPNTGTVKVVGVGVYWYGNCTGNVTSIPWGFLEPGEIVNKTVYIRNEGNIPVVLTLATGNWTPTFASEHIDLQWNVEGYVLDATLVVEAVLTLSVSEDISGIGNFGFDIIITGTEQAEAA